ncbi:MAG: FAD:protein FMN transferase [Planctomycetota bacterium]|nr:FAD:protein FMN transferase [Planctomycetota bacterium]
MKPARTLTIVLFGIAVFLAACSTTRIGVERFEFSRLCMGVEARIVLHAADRASAERSAELVFEELARLDHVLSDWNPDSELSRAVAQAADAPVHVSNDLFDVLKRALDIARITDGAFDPTIAPLVALWREARRTQRLPSVIEVDEARSRVGFQLVELDAQARTVHFARRNVRLDFGAIAKGFACQRAIEILTRDGIESALVEMGGDLVCSAAPPGRTGWRIDLESDDGELVVAHRAVSTSGDREQRIESAGRRYSHVIDSKTGLGLESQARAVVIASDGALADALATAISVTGGEAGLALASLFEDVDAHLEESHARVRFGRSTAGFARFLAKNRIAR